MRKALSAYAAGLAIVTKIGARHPNSARRTGGLAHVGTLILVTVLAGGVMAVVSLASRPRRALAIWSLRGQGDWGRGIPYGIAIALGAAVVVWGQLFGWIRPYSAF